jgi:hypothetical protein
MADGYFRNAPQLCFIERVGRLVRIALRLHRAPRLGGDRMTGLTERPLCP